VSIKHIKTENLKMKIPSNKNVFIYTKYTYGYAVISTNYTPSQMY